MGKLGEIIKGSVLDSVGLNGAKSSWNLVREINPNSGALPVAGAAALLTDAESFVAPNLFRDFVAEDNVSTTSEYFKGTPEIAASLVLDCFSWLGAFGVVMLTKQFEAAIITKVGLNTFTSAVVRTYDAIQRGKLNKNTA